MSSILDDGQARRLLLTVVSVMAVSCSSGGEPPTPGADMGGEPSCDATCAPGQVCRGSWCFHPCRQPGDCRPEQVCGQISEDSPTVCVPRGDEVLASEFDQTCLSDSDCALVDDGNPCNHCEQCRTDDAPINVGAVEAYQERWAEAREECWITNDCTSLSPAAFSCNVSPGHGVRCTSGLCEAYEHGFECGGDLSCEDTHGPEAADMICADGFCVECLDDSDCGADGVCSEGRCRVE